jgi:hypothetical protein
MLVLSVAASPSRNACMARVETSGSTSAKAVSVPGSTAA